jgi:hypothetical protein
MAGEAEEPAGGLPGYLREAHRQEVPRVLHRSAHGEPPLVGQYGVDEDSPPIAVRSGPCPRAWQRATDGKVTAEQRAPVGEPEPHVFLKQKANELRRAGDWRFSISLVALIEACDCLRSAHLQQPSLKQNDATAFTGRCFRGEAGVAGFQQQRPAVGTTGLHRGVLQKATESRKAGNWRFSIVLGALIKSYDCLRFVHLQCSNLKQKNATASTGGCFRGKAHVAGTKPSFPQQCPAVGITWIPIKVWIFEATWEAVRAAPPKSDTAAIEREIGQDAAVGEKGHLGREASQPDRHPRGASSSRRTPAASPWT